jgi:hypothetical protein
MPDQIIDAVMARGVHADAHADEVWIGNMSATDFPAVGWSTKRLGKIAYDTSGKRIPNFRPVFVQRAEIEAAGVAIPEEGAIDHRWC